MKKIVPTILGFGAWGFVILGVYCAYMNNNVKADSVKITWDCPCTTFIVDTVYLPSDSLDALLDSILEEMSREKR